MVCTSQINSTNLENYSNLKHIKPKIPPKKKTLEGSSLYYSVYSLFHLIYECTTFQNIFMRNRILCIRFAIQRDTIHIFMFLR